MIFTTEQFKEGDIVRRGAETGLVVKVTERILKVRFGAGDTRPLLLDHPSAATIRKLTEAEVQATKVNRRIAEYEHSTLLQVWLQWLREAGPEGVLNDCGCAKNELWNYTCACRTAVKVHHRFSIFTDLLRNELGYQLEDVELPSGKHKTVLVLEPSCFTKGGANGGAK